MTDGDMPFSTNSSHAADSSQICCSPKDVSILAWIATLWNARECSVHGGSEEQHCCNCLLPSVTPSGCPLNAIESYQHQSRASRNNALPYFWAYAPNSMPFTICNGPISRIKNTMLSCPKIFWFITLFPLRDSRWHCLRSLLPQTLREAERCSISSTNWLPLWKKV